MKSVARQFADNLLLQRGLRGNMTQELLGALACLHRTEVGQLERGLRIPRIDTLAKLSGALDIEPSALMAGIVWVPPEIGYGQFQIPRRLPPPPEYNAAHGDCG